MKPHRQVSRRSFLSRVVGVAAVAGSGIALGRGAPAEAQNVRYSGVTDCDAGQGADRPGYGVGTRNRYTDSDTGPNADPRCGGRRPNTGSPSGTPYSGSVQGPTGCSDSDYGQYGDPGGHGRTCGGAPRYLPNPRTQSGCTDSDVGQGSDSIGNGRVCTPR